MTFWVGLNILHFGLHCIHKGEESPEELKATASGLEETDHITEGSCRVASGCDQKVI